MGVIGSTVWTDKGVKGLIPNGRNADGSLINEEVVTDKLTLNTTTDSVTRSRNINISKNGVWTNAQPLTYSQNVPPAIITVDYQLWLNEAEGVWYEHVANTNTWIKLADPIFQAGMYMWDSSAKRITSFAPKLPFRAADKNDIDGSWVRQSLHIINGDTAFPLGLQQYRDYDISSYLPNDGHIYELAVEILAFSGSATNATSHWWISDTLGW